ncbi:MAG: hypothetical protein JWN34_203 [Bryobacterales bacterium]|nr:hypothetical protein [Bryobacterales bacterium]
MVDFSARWYRLDDAEATHSAQTSQTNSEREKHRNLCTEARCRVTFVRSRLPHHPRGRLHLLSVARTEANGIAMRRYRRRPWPKSASLRSRSYRVPRGHPVMPVATSSSSGLRWRSRGGFSAEHAATKGSSGILLRLLRFFGFRSYACFLKWLCSGQNASSQSQLFFIFNCVPDSQAERAGLIPAASAIIFKRLRCGFLVSAVTALTALRP